MAYRLQTILPDPPYWEEPTGACSVAEQRIQFYPTPNAAYELDVWARYKPPVIHMRHLSGKGNTVNLPIPDDHIPTMIVPLCAPHFLLHPKKAATLTDASAKAAAERGATAVRNIASRLSYKRPRFGIPLGW
jgi:hypothetical protein